MDTTTSMTSEGTTTTRDDDWRYKGPKVILLVALQLHPVTIGGTRGHFIGSRVTNKRNPERLCLSSLMIDDLRACRAATHFKV
jgi:hypothetical protein